MCMLKSPYPLSTDDINIEKDIERIYNNMSAKCLYKYRKQLHIMVLTITSEKWDGTIQRPQKGEYNLFPEEFCATAKD